jgi:putative membrane protein
MSQRSKPAAFRIDDPGLVMAPAQEPYDDGRERPRDGARGTAPALRPIATDGDPAVAPARRRPPWTLMFWASAGGLVVLATGLGIANLIEDLWSRAGWLGGLGAALAAVATVALLAILVREGLGLARLATIDGLRTRATGILASDDRAGGRTLGRELIALTRRMPRLARARARLESHLGDIIDGGDLVRLAERELMAPLDDEARRLVAAAARRVSIVTAVSPRAAVDMAFVLITALGLVRRLALLYGGRPGTLGLFTLFRHAVSHLALTGGMAASDGLIQQVIGHGVAAKLSARLGEGVLNGMLTARLGLAAIDATRPLPFTALRRPALNDVAASLLRGAEKNGAPEAIADQRPA